MTHYKVIITATASEGIQATVHHIKSVLRNPIAADNLLDKAYEMIDSLETMPERAALVPDSWLASRGLRMVSVEKYLLFYAVDKQSGIVEVLGFVYGKRDWQSLLRNQWFGY